MCHFSLSSVYIYQGDASGTTRWSHTRRSLRHAEKALAAGHWLGRICNGWSILFQVAPFKTLYYALSLESHGQQNLLARHLYLKQSCNNNKVLKTALFMTINRGSISAPYSTHYSSWVPSHCILRHRLYPETGSYDWCYQSLTQLLVGLQGLIEAVTYLLCSGTVNL